MVVTAIPITMVEVGISHRRWVTMVIVEEAADVKLGDMVASHSGGGPSHHPPLPGYTKIYLGQLPLHITEDNIADVFRDYCEIGELK